jgi:hypothetical protein
MSTEARLARLERRRRAAGEVSDQEHLRVGAAIVLARCRGDDTVVAALRAQLARLPPPAQGGALEAALRCAAARLGHFDGHPDDRVPELLDSSHGGISGSLSTSNGCAHWDRGRRPVSRPFHPAAAGRQFQRGSEEVAGPSALEPVCEPKWSECVNPRGAEVGLATDEMCGPRGAAV